MYRFSIDQDHWILRFSPKIAIETEERQEIFLSILQMGNRLSRFSHGDSFLMFSKQIGAIIFEVETVPSFILTVSTIISEDNWYQQKIEKK
ncbi:hypothetical protein [Bacillus rubiinfantis]|uniref:hypothetical protein n=1 Tax=Bacillus rubiinfantis TaxID=1499680 RepID=UPI0005A5D655|nr:hypothetical protein [Bacillus rubiinfantis]